MMRRRTERRTEAGLTLLEVLAAAMIFAMVMTVLVGTSSTAVHRSGKLAKRLEADLEADAFLADLEIQIKQRIAPTIEDSETSREDFTVQVKRTSVLAEGGDGGTGEIAGLLAGDLPEVVKHLYQYDIDVSWIDSSGVQNITRTTFAFDWQAAALEFAELFQGAGEQDPDPDAPGGDAELGEAEALERLLESEQQ